MSVRLKNQVSQNAFLEGNGARVAELAQRLCEKPGVRCKRKTVDWFQNYLTDRTQAVVITGQKPAEKRIPDGVPQGSVLGPL